MFDLPLPIDINTYTARLAALDERAHALPPSTSPHERAKALQDLAQEWACLGVPARAIAALEQARKLVHAPEAQVELCLALAYQRIGMAEWDHANNVLHSAQMFNNIRPHDAHHDAHHDAIRLLTAYNDQWCGAWAHMIETLTPITNRNDVQTPMHAWAHSAIAVAKQHLNGAQAAEHHANVAEASLSRISAADIRVHIRLNLAEICLLMNEFDGAKRFAQDAMNDAHALFDLRLIARSLNAFALTYALQGQRFEAQTHYQQAWQLAQQSDYRALQPTLLSNLAINYLHLGDSGSAIIHAHHALTMAKSVRNPLNQMYAHNNLAVVIAQTNATGASVYDHLESAQKLADTLGDLRMQVTITCSKATLLSDTEKIQTLERTLPIARSLNNTNTLADTLIALANAYLNHHDLSKATAHYQETLALAQNTAMPQAEAQASYGMAQTLRRQYDDLQSEQRQQCVVYVTRALAVWHQLGDYTSVQTAIHTTRTLCHHYPEGLLQILPIADRILQDTPNDGRYAQLRADMRVMHWQYMGGNPLTAWIHTPVGCFGYVLLVLCLFILLMIGGSINDFPAQFKLPIYVILGLYCMAMMSAFWLYTVTPKPLHRKQRESV
jgi:tetratricopeptide (TPR) repeat protein